MWLSPAFSFPANSCVTYQSHSPTHEYRPSREERDPRFRHRALAGVPALMFLGFRVGCWAVVPPSADPVATAQCSLYWSSGSWSCLSEPQLCSEQKASQPSKHGRAVTSHLLQHRGGTQSDTSDSRVMLPAWGESQVTFWLLWLCPDISGTCASEGSRLF